MDKIKKGSIVTRNSYGNDVIFYVKEIIRSRNLNPIAILKGVTLRIEASSPLDDLRIVNDNIVDKQIEEFERNMETKVSYIVERYNIKDTTRKVAINNKKGLILHLDGDKRYAEKSARVYQKFKLKAVVKNIKENRQPHEIMSLLNKYNPEILVITRS